MKEELKKIIAKYNDKGSALLFKVEKNTDTDTILTYSGVLNGGLSVFFVAIELDKPLESTSLDLLKDHIALIGNYDHMQGQTFVLFYETSEDEWYKLSVEQLKICWKDRKNFPGSYVESVKKTVYGPDFLDNIYMPFQVIRNNVDENDPTAVFFK